MAPHCASSDSAADEKKREPREQASFRQVTGMDASRACVSLVGQPEAMYVFERVRLSFFRLAAKVDKLKRGRDRKKDGDTFSLSSGHLFATKTFASALEGGQSADIGFTSDYI
jgi:hypothetical protein